MSEYTLQQRILIVLHIIAIAFCMVIFLILLDYTQNKNKIAATKFIKHSTFLSIIMYMCSSTTIVCFNLFIDVLSTWGSIALQITQGTFYRIAQILLYVVFVKRLQHSFRNTKYTPSITLFSIFYILIIMFILVYISKNVYFGLCQIYNNSERYCDFGLIGDVEATCSAIIDIILTTLIISTFVRKLWLLNIDLIYVDHGNINEPIMNESDLTIDRDISITTKSNTLSSLNDRQKVVISIMSKITLLSFIALISTQIVIYLGVAMFFYDTFNEDYYANLFSTFQTGYWAVNSIICTFCIALMFDFALYWYEILCACPNTYCIACCYRLGQKQVKKAKKRCERYSLVTDDD
eukprot:522491_1